MLKKQQPANVARQSARTMMRMIHPLELVEPIKRNRPRQRQTRRTVTMTFLRGGVQGTGEEEK